jgi:hypothetical protein
MNKPGKCVACAVAFWVTTIISILLFGLFSAWAMSELGPAQQEAIGAINTPWISAQRDPAFVPSKPDTAVGRVATTERPVATPIATKASR